ncbi:hypothetical protein C8Q78DRAFT_1035550 [Trametes maxima]|nr:hypothetical protein C8Q78DRAFT_1035550 [Trametes maxima]
MAAATVSASSRPAYPTTPLYDDPVEFVTAYLTVHVLSDASRIYSYLFWFALAAVLVCASLLHHLRIRGGYVGAVWSKWALRRRTWRKKHALAVAKARSQPHRQPSSLPSNAQILTLTVIFVASMLVAFLGPDYLPGGSTLWTLQNFPSATTTYAKRAFDTSVWDPFQPHYIIQKTWWSSSNRTGLIAFALFPLCILFALKSPPFAIFSLPFLVQLYCDKLLWLHKWTARIIYLLTVLHVVFWCVQLTNDQAWMYAWKYQRFLFAWTAFGCMTLLFVLSIAPIRRAHYEAFWFLHVLLVPLTLVMSALHHPMVGWWCWAALGLWLGERTWRFTWWLYTNGFLGGKGPVAAPSNKLRKASSPPGDQKVETPFPAQVQKGSLPDTPPSGSTFGLAHYPPIPATKFSSDARMSSLTDYLLPGRTVRLRIVTPGYLPWAPGQHFLISSPHADGRVLVFLIRAKNGWTKDLWDTVVLMISRGQHFQKGEPLPRCDMPKRGVLLRACVDGPLVGDYSSVLIVAGGSGVSYALSVLQYVCLCLAGRDGRFLGGKSGGYGQRGYKTTRVRFVWLVREFAHIQWCASVLRRCMDLVPSPELQIDIFVTNVKPIEGPQPSVSAQISFAPFPQGKEKALDLQPPQPTFVQEARPRSRTSISSEESGEDSDVDLSYYTGHVNDEGELGYEEHMLDYTNFEGDDDTEMPGEAQFNLSVKQEGRTRRRNTRRISMALFAKQELIYRASETQLDGPATSSAALVNKRVSLPPIDTEPNGSRPSSIDIGAVPPSAFPHSPQSSVSPYTPNSAFPLIHSPNDPSGSSPRHSRNLSAAGYSPASKRVSLAPTEVSTLETPITPASRFTTRSRLSQWTDTDSFAALVPKGDVDAVREQLRLVLDEEEIEDVGIVAEHARPGRPKLDRILADEVERAKGAIAVGCCGPTSLDAMIRKIIAAQISPERIKRGDMRGSIALFSEEFSY